MSKELKKTLLYAPVILYLVVLSILARYGIIANPETDRVGLHIFAALGSFLFSLFLIYENRKKPELTHCSILLSFATLSLLVFYLKTAPYHLKPPSRRPYATDYASFSSNEKRYVVSNLMKQIDYKYKAYYEEHGFYPPDNAFLPNAKQLRELGIAEKSYSIKVETEDNVLVIKAQSERFRETDIVMVDGRMDLSNITFIPSRPFLYFGSREPTH